MAVEQVNSHVELIEKIKDVPNAYLLLYKEGSDQSECAKRNVEEVANANNDVKVFLANVVEVRDIHPEYSITSVPSMLEFEKGNFKNTIKGCHQKAFYQNLLDHIIFEAKAAERPQKRVTVYTTPACPWCTTVKSYLRKNGIRYSEVDVASDQNAAQNMVSKSGQQGVPQTEVNGQMVIGFDQTKLNQLLEIKTN